jgi:UDP-glucose 4-epimerase
MPTSKTVLISGGAGYIGSHVVLALMSAGWEPVVVDDFSTGIREAVPGGVPLEEGNIGDEALMADILARHRPVAVLHFAGSIVAPESTVDPLKYYANNTSASRNLIASCVAAGVNRFLFSSTAAIYGNADSGPIREDAPEAPINPYGTSKLMTEWMLRDTEAATDLRYLALRYFNVAGADPEGRVGQSTPNATHLIKVASQAILGMRDGIDIYGEDYATPDGTCIRDYIHVSDLAAAHVAGLDYLLRGGERHILNCGYGHGFSVREVLAAIQKVAAIDLEIRSAPRRAGDPIQLIADSAEIRKQLGWQPRHDDLEFIVKTALDWERKLSAAG